MRFETMVFAALAALSAAATPVVSNVSMCELGPGTMKVTYTLTGAPAIVTFSVTTNGVSIGEKEVSHTDGLVNRLVKEDGTYTFLWYADRDCDFEVDAALMKPVITVWTKYDPPDYVVFDLVDTNILYYTSAENVPDGILATKYRTTMLPMRRIRAKNVEWTMGGFGGDMNAAHTDSHQVKMTNDYYIGVFELTQMQYMYDTRRMTDYYNYDFFSKVAWQMRPRENCGFYDWMRGAAYPEVPVPPTEAEVWTATFSYIARFRQRFGMMIEVPSEAQWEFAARAGTPAGYWGDLSRPVGTDEDADPNLPGRYLWSPEVNGDGTSSTAGVNPGNGKFSAYGPDSLGTAICGTSGAPNAWGLYDVFGNVEEITMDYHQEVPSMPESVSRYGDPNMGGEGKLANGSNAPGNTSVYIKGKGGSYKRAAKSCVPWLHGMQYDSSATGDRGYRLVIRIDNEE